MKIRFARGMRAKFQLAMATTEIAWYNCCKAECFGAINVEEDRMTQERWYCQGGENPRVGPVTRDESLPLLANSNVAGAEVAFAALDGQKDIALRADTADTCADSGSGTSSTEQQKQLPIKWLVVYTYGLIPVGIVAAVAYLVAALTGLDTSLFQDIGAPPSGSFAMGRLALMLPLHVVLFIGLHRRRLWGWYLNYVVLVLGVLLGPSRWAEDVETYIGVVALGGFVWLLPNAIYFNRRKHLFA